MISGIQNIWRIPELRARILFTFGMLAVYRVGCVVVTPGINSQVIRDFFAQMSGTVFGLMNLFSGGAMEQLSIFALGIMPYISATIIFQLLTVVIPALEALKKEGEQGQKKINQWSRYATIVLALFQSLLIAFALEGGQFGEGAVLYPGWGFRIVTMVTLTSGTAFIMWLGEQVTERGIGNGISLIIFSGIVVSIPSGLSNLADMIRNDQFSILQAALVLVFALGVVAAVVFVERGQRRIPIQHARRAVGKQVAQGGMSYFPLRVNSAGVIPPIFASSLLMFPLTVRQFSDNPAVQAFIDRFLNPGDWTYNLIYVAFIIFFCFFYTALVFNPRDVAENLKRSGAFIPGIRPGEQTAKYIDDVITRLTMFGAVYITLVCLLPNFMQMIANVPFNLGGTALLISVVVTMDFWSQVQSHLMSHQYDSVMKKSKLGSYGRGGI